MRKIYISVLLSILILISGCATPLNPDSVFEATAEKAVVIVEIINNSTKHEINNVEQGGFGTIFPLRLPAQGRTVNAYSIKVGEIFWIEKVNTLFLSAAIDKPKYLKLNKSGIYFYGTISIDNGKAYFNYESDPKVISEARLKYKNIFSKLKPINF